jgi:protoporphyrinogen oxidase
MNQIKLQERWAIVGGGFLGMTLALRLAQQGRSVTLFEAAASLGGLAAAWQLGDVVWDRHYHVTLSSDAHLRSLLKELDLESELHWKTARTGFFCDSKLYSMSNSIEFLKFPPLGLIDKLRLAATILRASRIKNGTALGQISAEDWLRKWSGARVTQKIWLPLLRAKLGEGYRDACAAFIWAIVARMYAARRTGAKTELFGYVPGGYARILQTFQQLLETEGVEIRLAQPVHAITPTDVGGLRIELDSTHSEIFSNAVVTTTAPLAARICPALSAEEKDRLAGIKYQGIVCASLLLKNSLSPYYITNITDGRIPYTAVIEMSSLVDRGQFDGRSLVYLPKYVDPDSAFFNLTDEQVRAEFEPALTKMYARFKRSDILCFRVSRVKYLLPVPTINYSAKLPKNSTSIPGLHILNSTQIVNGTLNVNETIRLAESAATEFAKSSPVRNPITEQSNYELTEANR